MCRRTALHVAAERDALEVVEMLLAAGADVNTPGYGGLNALQMADREDHLIVVKMLLAAEAINDGDNSSDDE